MLAKQISKDAQIFCPAEMPIAEVFNKMVEVDCDCMPIVESLVHRNIIGTITEHDICQKFINGGLNPQRASAGRILNGQFTSISGEATLEECAAVLEMTGAQRLFVVDEYGALIGVITEKELAFEKPIVSREPVVGDFAIAPAVPPKVRLAH